MSTNMRRRDYESCFWDYFTPFVRIWGVFSSIVLCGVGVDIAMHRHTLGIYYIIFSMFIFFFEMSWAISLFIQVCIRNEMSTFITCWNKVLWFNHWKKSLIYALFSMILFTKPNQLWLSIVSGIQLLTLAGLYLILSMHRTSEDKIHPAPRLLHSQSPSQDDNYDKFDELGEGFNEELDDTMPTPLLNDNLSEFDKGNVLDL